MPKKLIKPYRISRISLKLSLAIAAIIVVTLMAAMAAWMAMVDINRRVKSIGEEHLPLFSTATHFSELAGSINANTPKLIGARSNWEQEAIWESLEKQINALSQLVNSAAVTNVLAKNTKSKLLEFLPKIQINLQRLNEKTSQNFDLQNQSRILSEALRWTHASFLDEILPILEDSRFNTQDSIEQFASAQQSSATEAQLQQVLRVRESLMQLNADSNLAMGLIIRASSQTGQHEIDTTLLY